MGEGEGVEVWGLESENGIGNVKVELEDLNVTIAWI